MGLSDLRGVNWTATVKLAVARGFASALVLTVAGVFVGAFSGPDERVGGALRFLLIWTFAAAVTGIVYMWILQAIAATLGRVVGIVTLVTSIMQFVITLLVAAGDPLVYAINRRFPAVLDVADFKMFNLVAIIVVYDDTASSSFDASRLSES